MHLPAASGTPLSANSQIHRGAAVMECFLHKESVPFPSQILLHCLQTDQQRQLIYGMVRKIKLLNRKIHIIYLEGLLCC